MGVMYSTVLTTLSFSLSLQITNVVHLHQQFSKKIK